MLTDEVLEEAYACLQLVILVSIKTLGAGGGFGGY